MRRIQEITARWLNRGAGMLGMLGIIVALAVCDERFVLFVKAAPATLRSSDATIYEQTNEGSDAIGNLVEGSSFEYVGDVTAEDGSIWHQIITSDGATGYIRGDREMEINEEAPASEGGREEPAPEEEPVPEGGPALEEGNAPAEQDLPEEGRGEPAQEESEPEGDAEEDRNEDEEGPEEEGQRSGNSRVENHRTKSYALDTSGRIKGKEDIVPAMNMNTENEERRAGKKVDITALLSILVVSGCGSLMYLCIKRLKRLKTGTEEKRPASINENKLRKKNDKRKRGQKRKNKKK